MVRRRHAQCTLNYCVVVVVVRRPHAGRHRRPSGLAPYGAPLNVVEVRLLKLAYVYLNFQPAEAEGVEYIPVPGT
eukprot:scaffold12017_cov120-Isochrysis_galbana.AAC.14